LNILWQQNTCWQSWISSGRYWEKQYVDEVS
jgi:hypothetical protein